LAATGQIFVKFYIGCFTKNILLVTLLLDLWTASLFAIFGANIRISQKIWPNLDNKFYRPWSNNIWTKVVYCNISPTGIL